MLTLKERMDDVAEVMCRARVSAVGDINISITTGEEYLEAVRLFGPPTHSALSVCLWTCDQWSYVTSGVRFLLLHARPATPEERADHEAKARAADGAGA